MIKHDHLIHFDPLETFLEGFDVNFLTYQGSEYLLRLALEGYSSITQFPKQDFSAELNPKKILQYLDHFKENHGQEWGKQPFVRSGVSDEKLSPLNDLERALVKIEKELEPFTKKKHDQLVVDVHQNVSETVGKMRKKIQKETETLTKLYAKANFWNKQRVIYLAASKIFTEKLFDKKIRHVDKFIKLKNDLYFSEYDQNLLAVTKQVKRYLDDSKLKNYLHEFIDDNNCKEIVEDLEFKSWQQEKKTG